MTSAVRFATPELEAKERAWQVQLMEDARRYRLSQALRTYTWNHCKHEHGGGGLTCIVCAVDFFVTEVATKLVEIDEAMRTEDATKVWVAQLGQWWVLPVGPDMAARVEEILVSPNDFRRPALPALQPTAPEMDLMVIGGEGAADAPTMVLLTPLRKNDEGKLRSTQRPTLRVPIAYLLEHGVRHS